ncbi:cysteine hydrolase family protein [Pseudolysinimonas sp.]|uniref:cysteine hydrolase family protein n=1 Tax=Pseudolysinimonas sp. TaxID=2680009 RepID=UPI003F7E87EF
MGSDDRAVLVAIDMQAIFEPGSPWGAPDFARASAEIQRLLPAFGDDVVFTRFVAPAEPQGAWIPYYEEWSFALVPDADPLYALSEPFREVARRVETRPTFGKWDAELARAMDGATEMVLAGVSTDCCVLSTALAAADAGVHVRVVEDACAGLSPEDHRRALDAMALYGPLIEVTSVDEVLASR